MQSNGQQHSILVLKWTRTFCRCCRPVAYFSNHAKLDGICHNVDRIATYGHCTTPAAQHRLLCDFGIGWRYQVRMTSRLHVCMMFEPFDLQELRFGRLQVHSIDSGYNDDAVGAIDQLFLCAAAIYSRPGRITALGIQLPCVYG